MLPCVISQDIVKYLHEIKGFSLEEIADAILLDVEEVESILDGKGSFKPDNITAIIQNIKISMLHLISEACPESHLDGRLKENVIFYKKIKKKH